MRGGTYDAIVVGAGIVGCACALELAKASLRVAVVEPGPVGGGATAAGMGHIVAMDDSEAQFALTRASQQAWEELYPGMPSACEIARCGTLWIAADAEEMVHVQAKRDYYHARGMTCEVLDEQALREAEPNLKPGLAGGLRVKEDCVIYPMTSAKWLLDEAVRRGATLIQGVAVAGLTGRSARLEDGTVIEAGLTVNAAGGHAPRLTAGLPIEPRKGHLAITDRYPGFVRHQLVELGYLKSAHTMSSESVAFNVQPRATGQLLLGSSRQFVGWERGIDRALLAQMVSRALEYMPGLAGLSTIRTWTGFRAATPDKLPLIGPWPAQSGLYVAAGHEGLGITTSSATARLIADMVCGRKSMIDPTPYLPSRVAHA